MAASGFAHPPRNVAALGVTPGMKVADFGAGSGAYVLAIAERLSGSGTVYAIDIQKDLLRRIKSEATKAGYKNVEVIWGDLDAPDGSKVASGLIDLVLMSNIVFQLNDRDLAFKEARRIVRPRGRLAIIDWSESFGGMGPQKEAVVDAAAAQALAEKAGFVFESSFDAGEHHYGLILRAQS